MSLDIKTHEYSYANFTKLLYFGSKNRFIIVAAKNYLLKFSVGHLSDPLEIRKIGPVSDSVLCTKPNMCSLSLCSTELKLQDKCRVKPTDVYVKSWTATDSQLVVCYNVYQGYCETVDLYNNFTHRALGNGYSIVTSDLNSHSTILHFENKLYTAIEINNQLNYQNHDFYVLSIRTLPNFDIVQSDDNVFNIFHGVLGKGFDVIFPLEFKGSFHIKDNRKDAASQSYVFFLVNQPENKVDPKNGKFQVRLARICSSDDDFSSFIDIGLTCGPPTLSYHQIESWHLADVGKDLSDWYRNNTRFKSNTLDKNANFDQILYINFKIMEIHNNYVVTLDRFVTCAFPMAEIMEVFDAVKKKCLDGHGSVNDRPYDIHSNDKSCSKAYFPDTSKGYCNNKARNKRIIGDNTAECIGSGHEIMVKDGYRGSSLYVFSVYKKNTIALIGGSNGYIYQYELFENRFKALSDKKLFNSPIQDIKLVDSNTTAFAISNSQMVVINLALCGKTSNCDKCLKLSPFCGWCISDGKCSTQDQCKPSLWMGYDRNIMDSMCPEITNVTSHNILEYSTGKGPGLKFQIIRVPDGILTRNVGELNCQYYSNEGMLIRKVTATYTHDSFILCDSLMQKDIPSITDNNSFVSIKLKVFINDSFLVESLFYIYDCSRSKSCSKCSENRFSCSWCILDNICVPTSSNRCTQGYIIESQKSHQCPKFEFLSKTVAFPAGSPIEIDLKVNNFNVYKGMKVEYLCHESCENNTVTAYSTQEVLKCQFNHLQMSSKNVIDCKVHVIWKLPNSISGLLENTNTFSFQVYNCTSLSQHCDDCLLLRPEYKCGFCMKSKKCVMNSDCDNRWITSLNEDCPSPIINEIIPANSTTLSETVILVKGRNFGFDKKNIQNSISLENHDHVIRCLFIDNSFYITSKQFQCQIMKAVDIFDGQVLFEFVYRPPQSQHKAKMEFRFFTPIVEKIEPTFGPLMGGTIITVIGMYLNVGSKRTISLIHQNSKIDCEIIENHNKMISCRLKDFEMSRSLFRRKRNADKPNANGFVSLAIDAKRFNFTEVSYNFFQNPTGIKISRDRFLPNGGQLLMVTGFNINVINKPYISFKCKGKEGQMSICRHVDKSLLCLTPKIQHFTSLTDCELRVTMEKTVLLYNSTVSIYPMPIFEKLNDRKKLPSTSWSFIEKKTKDESFIKFKFDSKDQIYVSAFDSKELNISIGKLKCDNVVVSTKFIECNLIPKNLDIYQKYLVTINIGERFQISLGYIQFTKGEISLDTWSLIIIIVLIAIVFAIIIFSSILIVKKMQRKNRKKHHEQEIFTKKIEQDAIDMMKKGLIELNDITIQNDVSKNSLPMYPYCVYILYNLFPNTHPRLSRENQNSADSVLRIEDYHYDCSDPNSHPLIFNKPIQVIEHTVEYSRKLSKLFEDELFVLILFSFLEEDDVVESKKSDIVSLLSLILMQDMGNYSQILKILIKDDFDKRKENEEEKAMFRQSDLLSKLLSNWFTILMYEHFQNDNPGGDLLTLYFIIQNVINNGPVDYVTNKSQYALNENSLLKERVNHTKLRIIVIFPNVLKFIDDKQDSEVEISVLNCDTIPQVKLKILQEICKYIPYSQWCKLEDLELVKLDRDDRKTDETEHESLINRKTLKEINFSTNCYYAMSDYGIKDRDTLRLFIKNEPITRSNSASASQSLLVDSNNASQVGFNLVNRNQFLNSQDIKIKPLRHILADSVSQSSETSKSRCCKKKVVESRLNSKETWCLIFTQVLKKKLETSIKLLFDDILDQDSVPHCVKDLFSYFNTICKDDKTLFSFKSNSLILRFWIHFITNIDFLFDVPLVNNVPVSECLKCIGRILMDVCSECQNKDVWLTQLFSDIIKEYSPKVIRYYESVNLPEENNNEYYGSIGIDGINISLAIVILYKNYIKPIHEKFIEAIRKSNKPIDRQNKWITILKEVNNLYSPEMFFSNGNGSTKTTVC